MHMSPVRSCEVRVLERSQLDASFAQHLDALARTAIEPNVFLESWMLMPALAHLEVPALILVTVWSLSGMLTGMFPLELRTRYRGLPMRSLRSWEHDYAFLNTPLVAAAHAPETIRAFLEWTRSDQAPAHVLDLHMLRADGPFMRALTAETAADPRFATHVTTWMRALHDRTSTSTTQVSAKHQKELRRQERRLGEIGVLRYAVLAADAAVDPWIRRFLELEARGWKGGEGTALDIARGGRAFFESIVRAAHARGQLRMLELGVDGVAVAMKCDFIGADGLFMFKIAYDEKHARHSPGVLLELFGLQQLETSGSPIAWMDSCARSDHFMANRLWTGRRMLADCSISGRGVLSRWIIRRGDLLRSLRRRMAALRRRGAHAAA